MEEELANKTSSNVEETISLLEESGIAIISSTASENDNISWKNSIKQV